MHIGYDAKRALNNKTGLGNYSRLLIESMLKHYPEHAYSLFTPKVSPQFQTWIEELGSDINLVLPEKPVHKLFHPYWRSMKLQELLSVGQMDIFHGLSHELPQGLDKQGIKSVVTVHDLIFLRYPAYYPRIDRYFYRKKYEHACREADKIVAISEQTAEDLQDYLKVPAEKIQVIYQDCLPLFKAKQEHAKDLEVLQTLSLSPGYILSVGTIEQRKNQDRIVRAYAQLPDDRPPLVLVGAKSAYWKEVQATIKSLGLEKEVISFENVPLSTIKLLYTHAAFSVYLSLFEGFGLPVLESISTGTAVLASNSSCLQEVGGDAALYVNPVDTEGVAMLMRQMLYDDDLIDRLKLACTVQSQQFSHERMTEELMELYQSLM